MCILIIVPFLESHDWIFFFFSDYPRMALASFMYWIVYVLDCVQVMWFVANKLRVILYSFSEGETIKNPSNLLMTPTM